MVSQKKLVLYTAIIFSIFVLYTSFGFSPDIYLFEVNGCSWGIKTKEVYVKFITILVWMIYFIYDEGDN